MPRLPPVDISPQARLRARLCPGVGISVVTLDQSQSSSSATNWAKPVRVPWPISERAMRITTESSGLTTTQMLISLGVSVVYAACAMALGAKLRPKAKPLPTAAELTKNWRRDVVSAVLGVEVCVMVCLLKLER